ncbi:hypothetical protein GCM10027089_35770 [Nocardia thraciensis]
MPLRTRLFTLTAAAAFTGAAWLLWYVRPRPVCVWSAGWWREYRDTVNDLLGDYAELARDVHTGNARRADAFDSLRSPCTGGCTPGCRPGDCILTQL